MIVHLSMIRAITTAHAGIDLFRKLSDFVAQS